jgi:hypothetical protein
MFFETRKTKEKPFYTRPNRTLLIDFLRAMELDRLAFHVFLTPSEKRAVDT